MARKLADGVEFTAPTTQVDLDRFHTREAGETVDADTAGAPRDFTVEGNDTSAYIGVDAEYQTYGDPTQQPMLAEDGPEQVTEERFLDSLAVPKVGVVTATDEDGNEVSADRTEAEVPPVTVRTSANPEPNRSAPAKD